MAGCQANTYRKVRFIKKHWRLSGFNRKIFSLDNIAMMRDANNAYWSNVWGLAIIILGADVMIENELLRKFTSVVEPTLEPHNKPQSEKGYTCWQVSMDARNFHINIYISHG